MTDIKPLPQPPRVIRLRTITALVLILLFDVFMLAGGAVSLLTALWQITVRAPWAVLTKNPHWKRFRLQRCALYAAVALSVFAVTRINEQIAQNRADLVVSAIKRYKDENGRYPAALSDLVPQYLSAIPAAHPFSMTQNAFRYRNDSKLAEGEHRDPMFLYTVVAPMGWKIYDFKTNEWHFRD